VTLLLGACILAQSEAFQGCHVVLPTDGLQLPAKLVSPPVRPPPHPQANISWHQHTQRYWLGKCQFWHLQHFVELFGFSSLFPFFGVA